MIQRRYSVDEANRLLPLLRPVVEDVRKRYLRLQHDLAAFDRLERLEDMTTDSSIPPKIRARLAEMLECIRELQALRTTVVDPELGIVSLEGRLPEGQDVHFCWKLGEPAVRFWFPLGSGYGDRRPIPVPAAGA
jgi:hypothetical protein